MKEAEEMATEEQKTKVNAAIEELKKALEGEDIEEIKAKTEALQEAVYEVSALLYQKAQEAAEAQQQAAGEGVDAKGPEDTVVDADYEVVDDEKKA
jgi:molecular chaperone DnaK